MQWIIEGTLAETLECLRTLPVPPETPLRVSVEEAPTAGAQKPPDDALEPTPEAYFANAQRRNGIILVPSRGTNIPITTEFVKSLLEDE